MAAQPHNAAPLARECDIFCRYFAGQPATSFVAQKYTEAHARDRRYEPQNAFDRILLGWAAASPLAAQWCDSYACLFARGSLLRKKLVLLAAILESSAPEHGFDEQIQDVRAAEVILRMAGRGMLLAVRLAVALLFIAPVHFVCAVRGGAKERA